MISHAERFSHDRKSYPPSTSQADFIPSGNTHSLAALLELGPSSSFSERFQVLRPLETDDESHSLWVCKDKSTRKRYACKRFDTRFECAREAGLAEARVLARVKGVHPGIVQFHGLYQCEQDLTLVMELCTGGNLLELLNEHSHLAESAAKHVFRQLASAVATCHSIGVLHNDIKLENILFDTPPTSVRLESTLDLDQSLGGSFPDLDSSARVKLADFGHGVEVDQGEVAIGPSGTVPYMSPEKLRGEEYGFASDTWSLGMVLCAMLTGTLPFSVSSGSEDRNVECILAGHVAEELQGPAWQGVSDSAKDLVKRMLQADSAERPSVLEVLGHEWLAPNCDDAGLNKAPRSLATIAGKDEPRPERRVTEERIKRRDASPLSKFSCSPSRSR